MANIDIIGADGTIAFTSPLDTSNAPTPARACVVNGRIYRPRFVTTRPGSKMQRYTVGELRGEFNIRVIVTDDGSPPIPAAATSGLLTITLKTGQTYAFKVMMTSLGGIGYNSLTGEPQFHDYECVLSSTAITDTVTTV